MMDKKDLLTVVEFMSQDLDKLLVLIEEHEQEVERLRKLAADMSATRDDMLKAIYGDEDETERVSTIDDFRTAAKRRYITSSELYAFATQSQQNADEVFYLAGRHRLEVAYPNGGALTLYEACELAADAFNTGKADLPF